MHSFLFSAFGKEIRYDRRSVPPERFEEEIEKIFSEYDGFHVTMPYKRMILSHLTTIEGIAERLKSVNTVLSKDRRGFNTDYDGFSYMLSSAGVPVAGKSALVLGAGGAGRSCVEKLKELGAKVSLYGKYPQQLAEVYDDLGGFTPLLKMDDKKYDLVVNCTGVGMNDTVGELPLVKTDKGEQPFSARGVGWAIDLIYSPKQSAFLKEAEKRGANTLNGEAMLFYQAYLSDCLFLGRNPSLKEGETFFRKYSEETK